MHSLAGTVRSLPKLPDYLMQQSERLLQSWIIILYIVTLSIVSVKHCCLQENQNCLYTQADKSHHLLYSKFLNNGLSKIPSKAHERSLLNNSINVISTQLVIVLLLAGDIEVNPGPTPAVNIIGATKETTVPTNSGAQYTTIWSLPNHPFDTPLGTVGPVEFPRLVVWPVGLPRPGLLRACGPVGMGAESALLWLGPVSWMLPQFGLAGLRVMGPVGARALSRPAGSGEPVPAGTFVVQFQY